MVLLRSGLSLNRNQETDIMADSENSTNGTTTQTTYLMHPYQLDINLQTEEGRKLFRNATKPVDDDQKLSYHPLIVGSFLKRLMVIQIIFVGVHLFIVFQQRMLVLLKVSSMISN